MIVKSPWMWLSVLLALVVGGSLGLLGDRLWLHRQLARQEVHRSQSPVWFRCDERGTDVEDVAHYPYSAKYRQFLLARISSDLALRKDQLRELEDILEAQREVSRRFWGDMRGQYCGMRDDFRARIDSILDSEQRETFAKRLEELAKRQRTWQRRMQQRNEGGD
jgi:hypothetical protein